MSGATREEALEMRLFKSKTPSPNALKVPSFFLKFSYAGVEKLFFLKHLNLVMRGLKIVFFKTFKFSYAGVESQTPSPNALKVRHN